MGGRLHHVGGQTSVIKHWNGDSWQNVAVPEPSGRQSFLSAVAAVAANDLWAVGSDDELPLVNCYHPCWVPTPCRKFPNCHANGYSFSMRHPVYRRAAGVNLLYLRKLPCLYWYHQRV